MNSQLPNNKSALEPTSITVIVNLATFDIILFLLNNTILKI